MDYRMSSALALLRELRDLGVEVRADPPEILVRGPVDEQLRLRLRAEKAELLRHLEDAATYRCDLCGRFTFPEPTTCYWCRDAAHMDVQA